MPLLFSYGTLEQEDVQFATFGRQLQGSADELPCFELSLVEIRNAQFVASSGQTHHANITFNGNNDSRVNGTAFTITDSELAAADQYERPAGYERIAVTLESGKSAWVYLHASSMPGVSIHLNPTGVYKITKEIAGELSAIGKVGQADRLVAAMRYGSTGTEILMALHSNLMELLTQDSHLSAGLRSKIKSLSQAISEQLL